MAKKKIEKKIDKKIKSSPSSPYKKKLIYLVVFIGLVIIAQIFFYFTDSKPKVQEVQQQSNPTSTNQNPTTDNATTEVSDVMVQTLSIMPMIVIIVTIFMVVLHLTRFFSGGFSSGV